MGVWTSVVLLVGSLSYAAGVRQNVAQGKPAWMSTTYKPSLSAGKAVDGVTTSTGERYTAHTNIPETSAWWKVDLQREVQSALVSIYFRTDYTGRRNGLQLYTSRTNSSDPKEGDLCYTVSGRRDGRDLPDVLNVTCPGTWRYLTIYTETDNNGYGALLDFAEVQVWECATGYYGANCDQSCAARHCKMDSSCEVTQGQCVGGCAAGYQGTDCRQDCDRGMYGEGCRKICISRHCNTPSDTCDHVTGKCPDGCVTGYTGDDCLQNCPDGYYGTSCSLSCADRHCSSSSCPADGACDAECEAGWTLPSCTQECPRGKYGVSCNSVCGHCADGITCHHITGTCPGGCQAGWKLPMCQAVCDDGIYGLNCERDCGQCNGTCDAVDGRCPWGCTEGYNGSYCSVKLSSLTNSELTVTPVTAGMIGLAAGICLVVLGVLLFVLVRKRRLQWINSPQLEEINVRATSTAVDSPQPSDNNASIYEEASGRNIYSNDYSTLDVEAKSNNDYDVIKNMVYENM